MTVSNSAGLALNVNHTAHHTGLFISSIAEKNDDHIWLSAGVGEDAPYKDTDSLHRLAGSNRYAR